MSISQPLRTSFVQALSYALNIRVVDAAASNTKIHSIQFLRAFAAILVVLQHCIHEVNELDVTEHTGSIPFVVDGTFGVEIFFVISGFIMHALTRPKLGTPGYWWKFLVERTLRIAPLYWIATTLFILAAMAFPSQVTHTAIAPMHALASYLFIPFGRPGDGELSPILALGWSLNYEMFFYALFSLCIFLNTRSITATCATVFLLIAFLHRFTPRDTIQHYLSKSIILLFLAGVAISYLHQIVRRRLSLPSWAFMAIIGVLVAIKQIFIPLGATVQQDSVLAIAIVAVAAFTHINDGETRTGRVVTSTGDASYSLYLFHIFAIDLVIVAVRELHLLDKIGVYPVLGLCLVASLLAGHLAFRYIETPIISWSISVRKSLFGFISKPQP